MQVIYEPKGKAREYSPLALNIYSGCDHDCKYCYVPNIKGRFNSQYRHNDVLTRKDLLKNLEKQLKKDNITKQVLLSFTADPYCKKNDELQAARGVLELLCKYDIPIAILSKGGGRILQDLDIFKKFKNIKVGASLTFIYKNDSLKMEPGAALSEDRINTLRILSENKIKTWVSLEPVIDPEQTLRIIEMTHKFVDHYKIGKLNHNKKHEDKIDWALFLKNAVILFRKYNKKFYVKEDLLKFSTPEVQLNKNETDKDYLCLTKAVEKQGALI